MGSRISPILLVEDDDILAGLLVEILGGLGDVVWSASAEEAEERLSARQWDLIVADVELPGRTGIEFVGRAKALHPLCSMLIVSGRSSFDYAVGAIRAGATTISPSRWIRGRSSTRPAPFWPALGRSVRRAGFRYWRSERTPTTPRSALAEFS